MNEDTKIKLEKIKTLKERYGAGSRQALEHIRVKEKNVKLYQDLVNMLEEKGSSYQPSFRDVEKLESLSLVAGTNDTRLDVWDFLQRLYTSGFEEKNVHDFIDQATQILMYERVYLDKSGKKIDFEEVSDTHRENLSLNLENFTEYLEDQFITYDRPPISIACFHGVLFDRILRENTFGRIDYERKLALANFMESRREGESFSECYERLLEDAKVMRDNLKKYRLDRPSNLDYGIMNYLALLKNRKWLEGEVRKLNK